MGEVAAKRRERALQTSAETVAQKSLTEGGAFPPADADA